MNGVDAVVFTAGVGEGGCEYRESVLTGLEGLGIVKQFLKIDIPLIFPQIKYIFIKL